MLPTKGLTLPFLSYGARVSLFAVIWPLFCSEYNMRMTIHRLLSSRVSVNGKFPNYSADNGAGTGGHIFPALSVARELQMLGAKVEWLGTPSGLEHELLANTEIPLHTVRCRVCEVKDSCACCSRRSCWYVHSGSPCRCCEESGQTASWAWGICGRAGRVGGKDNGTAASDS